MTGEHNTTLDEHNLETSCMLTCLMCVCVTLGKLGCSITSFKGYHSNWVVARTLASHCSRGHDAIASTATAKDVFHRAVGAPHPVSTRHPFGSQPLVPTVGTVELAYSLPEKCPMAAAVVSWSAGPCQIVLTAKFWNTSLLSSLSQWCR